MDRIRLEQVGIGWNRLKQAGICWNRLFFVLLPLLPLSSCFYLCFPVSSHFFPFLPISSHFSWLFSFLFFFLPFYDSQGLDISRLCVFFLLVDRIVNALNMIQKACHGEKKIYIPEQAPKLPARIGGYYYWRYYHSYGNKYINVWGGERCFCIGVSIPTP